MDDAPENTKNGAPGNRTPEAQRRPARAELIWDGKYDAPAGNPWAYLKVLQTAYKQLQPTEFADLLVLEQRRLV